MDKVCSPTATNNTQTPKCAGMLIGRHGDVSSKRVCGLVAFAVAVGLVIYGSIEDNTLMFDGAKMLLYFATGCLVGGTAAERLGSGTAVRGLDGRIERRC